MNGIVFDPLIPADDDRVMTLTFPGNMTAEEMAEILSPIMKTAIITDVYKKEDK